MFLGENREHCALLIGCYLGSLKAGFVGNSYEEIKKKEKEDKKAKKKEKQHHYK